MATNPREQLEQAIASIEAQRSLLGAAVTDASLAALRKQLAELDSPPAEEQRKLVSLLFADLVGFTALSENLDPEELRRIQQAYFTAVTLPIREQGGWIEKYIGDAILAVFGLPQASEDDPDRAVRAALGMQAALRELDIRPEADTGERVHTALQMRIGVHTGPVVVSLRGPGDFVVTGEAVNLASRLQNAAPSGGVLISHDTYHHVRGAFDLQQLEPLTIKGKSEPVQAYRLIAAKPRSFRTRRRGVEGVETHMVGREAELQSLQNAFFGAIEDEERSMVTIVGEPGLGKSRLLYEFENWIDLRPEQVRLFRGRARLETQQLPFGLLRDLFAFQFGIQDDDPLSLVCQKFETGISEFEKARTAQDETWRNQSYRAHFIGVLLGYDFSDSPAIRQVKDDPRQIHDRAMLYLIDYFRAAAQGHPILILLEDLHWADDSSLDCIQRLSLALHDQSAMLVGAARPVLYERRPNWMEGYDFHRRLDLHPLSRHDSRRLVEEVLQKVTDLPEALRELVVSNAEGNPFYVEELIKMLIEDGAILKGEAAWQVFPGRLAELRVPQTLTGVLQARLDSLPESERILLQQASVAGRIFWDELVEYFNQSAGSRLREETVEAGLAALRDKEMVFRREFSTFAGTAEHIFKHAVLREVTYETVLKRLRKQYHLRTAEWLRGQTSERASELTGVIADHLEHAGELSQAVALLTTAGDEAAAKYINQEAIQFYSRALALLAETDPYRRCQLLLKREKLYELLGKKDLQEKDLMELERLLATGGEESWEEAKTTIEPEIQLRRAYFTLEKGNIIQAEAEAEKAQELADYKGLKELSSYATVILASSLYRQGKYEQGKARVEQGLDLARKAGDLIGQRRLLNIKGMIAQDQMDWAAAQAALQESLELARKIGDRRGESNTRANLAMLAGTLGNLNEARNEYLEALSISREIGELYGEGIILSNLGWLAGLWGDFEVAAAYCQQNLEIALEIGDRIGEISALVNLSAFLGRQGNYQTALEYAERGLKIAHEFHTSPWIAWSLTYQGHAQAGLGLVAEAESSYQQALEIRRELGQPALACEPLAGLARLALAHGVLPKSVEYVEPILAHLAGGGTLDGVDEPLRVELTCVQVLQAAGDERFRAILEQACRKLRELEASAPDEATRRKLLEDVPWNREIIAIGDGMGD